MKQTKVILTAFLISFLSVGFCMGQHISNTYVQDGKIIVQFDNGNTKAITTQGNNEIVGFSRTKNFVLYQKLLKKSSMAEDEEGGGGSDQGTFYMFDLNTNKATVLFTSCHDGIGGTKPTYGGSSIYPNDNLCNVENIFLTENGERLFFQTEGWQVCPAVHYYNIKTKKLVFYKAGWLHELQGNAVVVQETGIDHEHNRGESQSKGRYIQTCLFDMNGTKIRELTEKEF